jgi:hypothetical protein
MNPIWIISMVLQWIIILALCLLVFSLMRQLGEITLRLNAATPSTETEKENTFEPYSEFPEIKVPLFDGGTFRAGGRQTVPCLIINFSPSCAACADMPNAIREFTKHVSPKELHLLVVLRIERDAAKKYVVERGLAGLSIALEEDIPQQIKTSWSPFAVSATAGGLVAASGKPKTLAHLLEMAQAARAMAESAPTHSRRKHEWGESAPYWNFDGESKTAPPQPEEAPQLAGRAA